MPSLKEAGLALAELRTLLPCFPELSVSECFSIPGSYKEHSFPNAGEPGVYFFCNANEEVIYVGKASSGLGARIGNAYIGDGGVLKGTKIAGAVSLYTVSVPKDRFFLAPAIEEFLIAKLRPAQNRVGLRGDS